MAIFAKMAQKKRASGGRVFPKSAASEELKAPPDTYKAVTHTKKDFDHFVNRLPKAHRDLARFKGVNINTQMKEGNTMSGQYNKLTENITLFDKRSQPLAAGYTNKPSFMFKGKSLRRNETIYKASVVNHEMGHAINWNGRFSRDKRWKDIAAREYISSIGKRHLASTEAWSEAYASYTRSKVSRQWLKKSRPQAHKYMEEFYNDSTKFADAHPMPQSKVVMQKAAMLGGVGAGLAAATALPVTLTAVAIHSGKASYDRKKLRKATAPKKTQARRRAQKPKEKARG
jgi:hypothetical protein